ncbi:MAG: MjaI family restriction endonuclease [Bacteroidales bacterium]|nr:MjaI family restriction endonuclease [Bacteroidales bacterium]
MNEEECVDYAYNLVLNRTYEGYRSEIDTIYGQLESIIEHRIEPAPDEWDRIYGIDFIIKIRDSYIGLQIKPISYGQSINQYQWIEMHKKGHEKFRNEFGGIVFFIFSIKGSGKKKKIHNTEVIDKIIGEIKRLKE